MKQYQEEMGRIAAASQGRGAAQAEDGAAQDVASEFEVPSPKAGKPPREVAGLANFMDPANPDESLADAMARKRRSATAEASRTSSSPSSSAAASKPKPKPKAITKAKAKAKAPKENWACRTCTFENEAKFSKCQTCGARKGKMVRR